MKRLATTVAAAAVILGTGILAGCSGDGGADTAANAAATSPPAPSAVGQPAIPPNLFASAPFEGTASLSDVKQTASEGDTVTFLGKIGGRVDPFTDGRAVFLVADEILHFCVDDGCPTPWDACCTPREDIVRLSATVQVTGPDGKPLPISLNGRSGLEPGANIQVRGILSQKGEGFTVIDAESIYVASAG